VVHERQVGDDDALAGGPRAEADVDVVGMEAAERLGVEAQVAHRPGRQHEQQAIDRVDRDIGEAVVDATARLLDAAGHLALPPGQRAHAARADRADDRHLRVGEQRAHERAEGRVEQLDVLMQQHERLETVDRGEVVERLVVGLVDRRGRLQLGEGRIGLHRTPQAGQGEAGELVAVGDAGGERDHATAASGLHRRDRAYRSSI
jgi:hypothetical protein